MCHVEIAIVPSRIWHNDHVPDVKIRHGNLHCCPGSDDTNKRRVTWFRVTTGNCFKQITRKKKKKIKRDLPVGEERIYDTCMSALYILELHFFIHFRGERGGRNTQ